MEKKKLTRSHDNEIIAGVCGGLGDYFDVDPTIIRIIFVILTLWGGLGIILYIIGIIIIPYNEDSKQEKQRIKTKATEKSKEFKEKVESFASDVRENIKIHQGHNHGEITLGLIIILLGLFFLLRNFIPWFDFGRFWPLILVIIGLALIASASRRGER